jgi:hypothetical protein
VRSATLRGDEMFVPLTHAPGETQGKRFVLAGCTWCCFAMMMCGWLTQI